MFIAILEMRHTLTQHGHLYLFSVFVLLTWLVWVLKVYLSRMYRPWRSDFRTTTSVVIPVVDEPLALFRDVLRRIVQQAPTEIVVVINGPRNPDLERVCDEFAPHVRWKWTPVAGKRNAVRVGVKAAAETWSCSSTATRSGPAAHCVSWSSRSRSATSGA